MPIPFPGDAPTTPAVPEKTFPHLWVSTLNINARTGGAADTAYCAYVAYNSDTGERLPQVEQQLTAPLWDLYANVPSFAAGLDAMLASLPDVVTYLTTPAPEPEPEPEPEA